MKPSSEPIGALFAQMIVIAETRELSMSTVLSYPLGAASLVVSY